MNAGKELDALVAEKVMGGIWDEGRCRICGWSLVPDGEAGCWKDNCSMRPPPERSADEPAPYSTDIAAAWRIVEKMAATHALSIDYDPVYPDEWTCWMQGAGDSVSPSAESAPLAICLAALQAVGVEV